MKHIYKLTLLFFIVTINTQGQNCAGILNEDFSSYSTCPTYAGQTNLIYNWNSPTIGSPEFYACSFLGSPVLPFITSADSFVGQLCSGSYPEYIGQCLQSPWLAGETYTVSIDYAAFSLNPDDPGDIPYKIIGYAGTTCPSIVNNFSDPLCAEPGWVEIGSFVPTAMPGDSGWTNTTITLAALPSDIAYIAFGKCDSYTSSSYVFSYYLIDNICASLSPTVTPCNSNVKTPED